MLSIYKIKTQNACLYVKASTASEATQRMQRLYVAAKQHAVIDSVKPVNRTDVPKGMPVIPLEE